MPLAQSDAPTAPVGYHTKQIYICSWICKNQKIYSLFPLVQYKMGHYTHHARLPREQQIKNGFGCLIIPALIYSAHEV